MSTLFNIKYQPKVIDEFELNCDLKNLFKNLILMDNISLMIIGNSGSGKSRLIDVLINEYYYGIDNNLKQNNIMIINTLKEQGIQYYRNEVKTFCQIPSTIKKKKKIIVLDDIDLINEQSQQVFRNCMDKYRHNVHFICSCINTQKVIESIQSRMTNLKLASFTNDNLKKIMLKIKKNENIEITKEAQDFIINLSNNSVRILINYMEKFKLMNKKIDLSIAKKLCTNINFKDFQEFLDSCIEHNLEKAVVKILQIFDSGFSVIDILDNFFIFIKMNNQISEENKYEIIKLLCKYITIFHNIHEDEIELCLFANNIIDLFVNKL
jgi:DNA polymerase III delta prime subunit